MLVNGPTLRSAAERPGRRHGWASIQLADIADRLLPFHRRSYSCRAGVCLESSRLEWLLAEVACVRPSHIELSSAEARHDLPDP